MPIPAIGGICSVQEGHELSSAPRRAAGFAAARRRAVPMAVAFVTVLAGAGLLAVLWPPTYRATGTLRLDLSTVPADATPGGTTAPSEQQWQQIARRVLAPADLLEIAGRHDLYRPERVSLTPEALADRMLRDVRLERVDVDVAGPPPTGSPGPAIAFTVAYDGPSPDLATRVASDLVGLFPLADTAPQQASPARDEADEADEAGTLQARIAELEQRIAEFRQQNAVLLPNAAPANPQQIDRVQKQLRDLDARSRSLERRIAADDPQLEEARSWLAMDRERYPPDHPSVLQLEREVANLEQQLETQRWAAREERATLVTQRRELQAQLEQLEQARQSRAAVEREYAALTSELQDAQARLAGIRQKAQAVTREDDRASRHDGPRFMLIAAPARPQAPIRPNRAALLAAGLLAAVAAAMAVMLLLEARNPWVRGPRGVAAVLGEAPLATLPWFGDARGAT